MSARSTNRLLEAGFLMMAATLAVHQIYDPDFWYHLAAGDRILKTCAVMRQNFFSYTFPDHLWTDVYWLYEVALSLLWRLGQAAAVIGFKVAMNVALAALALGGLRERRRPLGTVEAAVLVFGWILMLPRLTDRPELISYVLLAAMLMLLRRHHGWWCVPVQALWANVHGFFVFGIALPAVWAVGEWLRGQRRAAGGAAVVMLACGAASVLSPFGWRNLLVAQSMFASSTRFNWQIEESVSPFHPLVWATDGTGLLLIVFLAGAALLLAHGWRSVSAFDWMVTVATLPLALAVRRGVPVFVLCSLPGLLQCAAAVPEPRTGRLRVASLALMLVFAVDFAAGTHWLLRFRGTGRAFGWSVNRKWLPEAAATFVRERAPADARLLNAPFPVGNYLMWTWQGRPAVFVDGRTQAYPPEFWGDALAVLSDEATFARLIQQFNVSHLFIGLDNSESRAFVQRLATNTAWRQIYTDRTAVVFERTRNPDG
jgi:hypothetical protein